MIRHVTRAAVVLTGQGGPQDHETLCAYWAVVLDLQHDLHFQARELFERYGMLLIAYENYRGGHAAEALYFVADRMIFEGVACHRADRTRPPC